VNDYSVRNDKVTARAQQEISTTEKMGLQTFPEKDDGADMVFYGSNW